MTNLEAAIAFVSSFHIPVFPVFMSGSKRKAPMFKDPYNNGSEKEEQIRAWSGQYHCAFGAYPGAGGYAVIDLDNHNGKDGKASLEAWEMMNVSLPDTFEVRTPSGGTHLWFKASGLTGKKDAWLDGVDVHGGEGSIGGYVLIPNSSTDSGKYEITGRRRPADIPSEIVDQVNFARRGSKKEAEEPMDAVSAADADYSAALMFINDLDSDLFVKGQRDNKLAWVASELKEMGVGAAFAIAAMSILVSTKVERIPGDEIGQNDIRRIVSSIYGSDRVKAGIKAVENLFPDSLDDTMKAIREGIYDVDTLMSKEFGETQWVVPGLIPFGLTVVAGASKSGKSFFVLQMCAEVSKKENAGEFLNRKVGGLKCVYFALEDTPKRLQERLSEMYPEGLKGQKLRILNNFPPMDGKGVKALESTIIDEAPDVIVIDVWQKIRVAETAKSNAYKSEYAEVSTLKTLADQYGIAIILVHHLKKIGNGDIQDKFDRINGSSAIMGCSDCAILFDRPDRNDGRAVLSFTGREVEDCNAVLVRDTGTPKWVYSQENENGFGITAETPVQKAVYRVLQEAGEGGITLRGIMALCPKFPESSIKTTIGRWYKRDGSVEKIGRGLYALSSIKELKVSDLAESFTEI